MIIKIRYQSIFCVDEYWTPKFLFNHQKLYQLTNWANWKSGTYLFGWNWGTKKEKKRVWENKIFFYYMYLEIGREEEKKRKKIISLSIFWFASERKVEWKIFYFFFFFLFTVVKWKVEWKLMSKICDFIIIECQTWRLHVSISAQLGWKLKCGPGCIIILLISLLSYDQTIET